MMYVDRITEILENLAHEQLVRSIRLKTTEQQSKSMLIKPEGSTPVTISNNYIQTAKGQRYFDTLSSFPDGGKLHRAAYCDGTRCAEVSFNHDNSDKPDYIQISKQFLDDMRNNTLSIPFPLNSYYVGPKALIDALPAAEARADGEVIGRPCDVFVFKSVGPPDRKEDLVYYLDKQTSVPLKVSCYIKPEHLEMDRPLWSWEATTLNDQGDHHVAMASLWTRFVVKNASREVAPKVNMTAAITVDEVELDRDIPVTSFWPAYGDEVRTIDLIHPRAVRAPAPRTAVSVTDPIRVEEPAGLPWAMLGSAFLVVALIAAAMGLRNKRSSGAAGARPV
jgi:hypothetical protein